MPDQVTREVSELVCIGFDGPSLTTGAAELLAGGVRSVIYFARNYTDAAQVRAMSDSVRRAAEREVLVTVDHEGGRVQRFHGEGFPALPSGREMGAASSAMAVAATSAMSRVRMQSRVGFSLPALPVG